MYDDGINGGDLHEGDGVYSLTVTVPDTVASGVKSLWVTCTDEEGDAQGEIILNVVPPGTIIMDNEQADYMGIWPAIFGNPQSYGDDFQYNENEAGVGNDTATWTPPIAEEGYYKVYAWWVANPNRATDAPYTVYYDGGFEEVRVNQQVRGGKWNYLGIYPFAAGTGGSVVLSDDANGYVNADAVKFELIDPTQMIMDNDEAAYEGDWPLIEGNPEAYGGDFQYNESDPGVGEDTATWTPYIPVAGDYKVYAWWVAHANRATNAPYTITYDGGSEEVRVDQQIDGGQWNLLGTYYLDVGTSGSIVLSDDANGYVVADAIKLELQP